MTCWLELALTNIKVQPVRHELQADGLLVPVGIAFSDRSFQRMSAIGKGRRALI